MYLAQCQRATPRDAMWKTHTRSSHEGRSSKSRSFWDTRIAPILDEYGYMEGTEFFRRDCPHCGGVVKVDPVDEALFCQECGTVFNQGNPFSEEKKIDPMRGMHRFFKAIA